MIRLRVLIAMAAVALTPALAQLTITTPSPLPTGVATRQYSAPLSANGGSGGPSYTWYIGEGMVPPGISLNSTTGQLSGTTTSTGDFNVTVMVNDGMESGSKIFDLRINSLISIATTPLAGQVGVPFQNGITATGGQNNGPYTFTLFNSTLPAGLILNPQTGAITGIPQGPAGSFSIVLTVTDTASPPQTSSPTTIPINIAPVPLAIVTQSSLPDGVRHVPYSQTLIAAGGTPSYSLWAVSSGTLPPGLSLNSSSGALTGTPTASGTFLFTVTVRDMLQQTASQDFFLRIPFPPIIITTASPLPAATMGVPYSQSFTATGGSGGYFWDITQGALPPGISLDSATGVASGTPTTSGTYTFTVRLFDSTETSTTKVFVVDIRTPTLSITTASPLPSGTAGSPYSQQFAVSGGTPPYTWQAISGTVPPGTTLSASNLSGTPTTPGTYNFVLRATDSTTAAAAIRGEKAFVVQINPSPIIITTLGPLPNVEPGAPYQATFAAAGGTPPYTWSVASGTLPAGLTLSSAGVLSGQSSQSGAFAFTARVRDTANQTTTKDLLMTVDVRRTPVEIATSSLPEGTVAVFYGATVLARGGTPPYSFSITGLPPGLESNDNGGISGTPTRAGQYTVRVSASDAERAQGSATLTITIRPGQVEITTLTIPEATMGAAYNAVLGARGGVPPYTWALSGGSLPRGLTLGSVGDLTGTPTESGTFAFTVQATDTEKSSGTKSFSLTVRSARLEITTSTLPDGTAAFPYNASLAATGGATPYRWSLSGSVPPGLSVGGDTGAISGTPTAPGTFTFNAQATDAQNQSVNKTFTVTIASRLTITTVSPPPLTLNSPGSVSFAATGGVPAYTWSTTSGAVPPGTSFAAGQLTGTPTVSGSFSFTVQATDANKASATKEFTVEVVSGVTITAESLPPVTAGTAYSSTLSATGGSSPYRWSSTGPLPPGVTLNESGAITGQPTAAGSFSFIAQVQDSAQPNPATSSRSFTIVVGVPQLTAVNITGLPDNPASAQQPRIALNIASPFPLDIQGTTTLSFTPDAANDADDPAIQFSTGGRTAAFTIPAGQTQAVFRQPDVFIQTGTVAGTITLTTTLTAGSNPVTCACSLVHTLRIPRAAPVIGSVRVTRTGNGFNLVITGFSSTREIGRGIFRFNGTLALQTNEVIVPFADVFNNFFRNNAEVGGQFVMTMPFIIQGLSSDVTSVSVILSNSQGDSQPVAASL